MPKRQNPYLANYDGKFDHPMGHRVIRDASYLSFVVTTAYDKCVASAGYVNQATVIEQAKAAAQARDQYIQLMQDVAEALKTVPEQSVMLRSYADLVNNLFYKIVSPMYTTLREVAINALALDAGL